MKTEPNQSRREAPITLPPHLPTLAPGCRGSCRPFRSGRRRALLAGLALLGLATVLCLPAQTSTQVIILTRGWNAIWVDVAPTNTAVGAVFANLPVESAWPYSDKLTSAEFIRDLSELPWNDPSWRRWFPPSSPHAVLTTLFAVNAGKAFLVQVATNITTNVTLRITGQPTLRPMSWAPDAFNLRGFQVSSANPPTFGSYFAPSAAHAGQPMFRLDSTLGIWTNVAPNVDRLRPGEAYWVYCQGASTYPGPLKLKLGQGDGLDFGKILPRLDLYLQNLADSSMRVGINDLSGAGSCPLSLILLETNGFVTQPLLGGFSTTISSGLTERLQVAIRRNDMTATNYATILEITNDFGSRTLLRVTAETVTGDLGGAPPFAGLWVGSASVSNVCEVNSLVNSTNPTPTKSAFDLRLLIHVDTNRVVRLLKEVIQMWQNGTTTNDVDGYAVADQPGRYVLVTDDRRISQFQGSALRDGVAVGRRITCVGFEFDGGTNNYLPLTGSFATNGTLTGTIVLDPDFPTNPFRHKYHPDHDNLDAQFLAMAADATGSKEAFKITRQIELEFSPQDPAGSGSVQALDYGYDVLGGTYRETVTGLHKNPILARGQFRLKRAAITGVLNQ